MSHKTHKTPVQHSNCYIMVILM